MQQVLIDYLREFTLVYLDDIIVYSNSPEEYVQHLAHVFERLQEHALVLSRAECEFAKHDLQFLDLRIKDDTTIPATNHLRKDHKPCSAENTQRASKFSGFV